MPIYINRKDSVSYSNAMIQDYLPQLKNYVKELEYLSWVMPAKRGGVWTVMIQDTRDFPRRLENFISQMKEWDCEIFIRNERGDEWEKIE